MTIGANKIVILTIFTGLCAATIGAIFVYMYCKKEQDPAPAPESQINQHLPNNERDHNSERVEKSTENESSEVSGGKNWQISLGGHKKSRKNINERNLALNGSPITPRAEQPDQVLHEGEQSNSHLVEKFSSVGGYNEKRDITTQFRGHTENLHYHVIFDSKLSLKDFILKLREYKNFHDDTISNKIICSDEINVNNVLFGKLRRYATSRRFLEFFKFQENILQKLFKSYDMVENVLKKCEAYGLKTIKGTNDESTKMIYNYIGEVGGFIFNEINEIFLTGDDCLEAIGRMDSTALHEFAEEFSETLYRMLVEEKISDYNILRVAISCHFESFLAAFREKICPKPPQNFHVCSGIRIRILKMMAYDILSRALPDDLRKICFIMNNIIKITLEYEFFRARTIGVLLQLYKISEIDKKEDMTEEDSLQLFEGIKLHVESFEEFLKRSVVVLKSKVEIKQADVPNPANVNVPEIEDVGDKNEYGFGHSDQLKELILEGEALIPASQINHHHNIQTGNPSLELGNDTKLGDNVRSGLKPIEPAPEKKNNINMLVDDYISEVEGYKNFSDEIIRKKMTCFHINRNLVAEMDAMREYAQSQQGFLKLFMSKENLMLEIITSRENVMDILAQFKKLNNINVGEISKILSREIIPLQNVISNSISQIISSKKVLLEKIKKMNNKGFQKFVELLGQKFEKLGVYINILKFIKP